MISGATGALAVVMVSLVTQHGSVSVRNGCSDGTAATLAGALRWGKFIRMVPYPVMLGFVNGLAIVIELTRLEQFKLSSQAVMPSG